MQDAGHRLLTPGRGAATVRLILCTLRVGFDVPDIVLSPKCLALGQVACPFHDMLPARAPPGHVGTCGAVEPLAESSPCSGVVADIIERVRQRICVKMSFVVSGKSDAG